jgi:hypothetical protein
MNFDLGNANQPNSQNMLEGWVKIYTSPDVVQTKLVEDLLKQNGVESHIVTKPDSVLPMLGEATLYTPADRAEEALAILRDHQADGATEEEE